MLDYVIENINNYINKKVQMIESSKLEYILKNNLEKYNIYKSMLETLYKAYKFVDIKNYANIESKEGFFEEVEKYIDKETILKNIKKDTSFENLCELQKVIIKDTLGKIINEEYLDNRIKCFYKQTSYGVKRIKEGFPVCTRLIREIHKILMQGVRGEYKTPGEFRTSQNWIGGSMPSTAVYVPPPHTEIAECLTDFEKFINNEEIDTPDLIKIAILHYQFESIHPFLDGNGRIGRLLIPLYIQSKGMLDKSCLYISDYIERNKDTYYDMLTRVRTHNDMISWIKFFLEAVIETSKTAKEKFRKVVELTLEMDRIIMDLPVKPDNAKKVLEVLYNELIVSRKK